VGAGYTAFPLKVCVAEGPGEAEIEAIETLDVRDSVAPTHENRCVPTALVSQSGSHDPLDHGVGSPPRARLIAKQPVLSITIVVALATGVGLATVGFTLRDAVLHGSLPFANGDRFVRLVLHSEAEDNVELDLEAYHAIRDTSKSFAHLGAAGGAAFALENPDGTVETISVGLLTPRSFKFLRRCP